MICSVAKWYYIYINNLYTQNNEQIDLSFLIVYFTKGWTNVSIRTAENICLVITVCFKK